MRSFSDEAIVLSKKFATKDDILVCFMSRTRGVFWAVAKNGRKSRRRFMNSLEQPSLVQGYFRGDPRSGRPRIVEKVVLLDGFQDLKSDLVKTLSAWYILCISRDISVTGDSYDIVLNALSEMRDEKSALRTFYVLVETCLKIISAEGFGDHKILSSKNDVFALKDELKNLTTRLYGRSPPYSFILDEIVEQVWAD